MIAALDVHYDETASSALAAAVVFQNWDDERPLREYTVRCNGIAAYVPGQFFQRELPCLLAVLSEIQEPINVIVIDGYVSLGDKATTGELQCQFPFFKSAPKAISHEHGAAAEVERKWQSLLSHVRSDKYKSELLPLVEKAIEVPVLRRLFPFTSLSALCFSRCTGFPYSHDCPSACPSNRAILQGYMTPEQRAAIGSTKLYTVADSKGQFIGQGDALEAIDLIVRHLPPNCGPAIQGTADDLK
jgi:hypothetical protein